MSVLIKGLKLPPVGIRQCIVSFADNCLLITDACGKLMFESEYVEVPTPHGRLIDADRLIKVLQDTLDNHPNNYNDGRIIEKLIVDACKQFVEHCPATIEAEVSE